MANFKTHVSVAFGASSLAASVGINAGLFDAAQSSWYVFLGVVGGMLPDIDSDHSKPVKHLFMGLALSCAFAGWWTLKNSLGQQSLMMAITTIFVLVRYLALYFFQRMTVHRGVFHSLLAGVFFSISLVCIEHYMLRAPILETWLSGVFLLLGFLVHLCLDEIFSVDLANGRMKKSFGTALKVYGYQNIPGSVLLLGLVACLLAVAPSSAALSKAFRLVDWARATELGPQFSQALKGVLG